MSYGINLIRSGNSFFSNTSVTKEAIFQSCLHGTIALGTFAAQTNDFTAGVLTSAAVLGGVGLVSCLRNRYIASESKQKLIAQVTLSYNESVKNYPTIEEIIESRKVWVKDGLTADDHLDLLGRMVTPHYLTVKLGMIKKGASKEELEKLDSIFSDVQDKQKSKSLSLESFRLFNEDMLSLLDSDPFPNQGLYFNRQNSGVLARAFIPSRA